MTGCGFHPTPPQRAGAEARPYLTTERQLLVTAVGVVGSGQRARHAIAAARRVGRRGASYTLPCLPKLTRCRKESQVLPSRLPMRIILSIT